MDHDQLIRLRLAQAFSAAADQLAHEFDDMVGELPDEVFVSESTTNGLERAKRIILLSRALVRSLGFVPDVTPFPLDRTIH